LIMGQFISDGSSKAQEIRRTTCAFRLSPGSKPRIVAL
jgi:hypothetical protein